MGLELIVQYYSDDRECRKNELDFCVRMNLSHPFIDRVHSLSENDGGIPEDIRTSSKFTSVCLGRRMTFQDAFEYANGTLVGKMIGISNLDIFLDNASSDWEAAERLLRARPVVLCQSRTEFSADGQVYLDPVFTRLAFANAQDAWFFISPLRLENIDFEVGTLGCDNAIADRIKKAGVLPVNMASRYRIFHRDECRGKHGGNTNQSHRSEAAARGQVYSRFPEKDGYHLLPDIDLVPSVDEVLKALGVDELLRYRIVSEILTERIRISNE